MSQKLYPPTPVKLIVGILCADENLITQSHDEMTKLWGAIDIKSELMQFTQTRYYEKVMGLKLLRQLVSFARLISPDVIAGIKHQSNSLEESLAQTPPAAALKVDRPINLDPGYVESSKLILVTTKNYSHRIYIGQSMYAEATLHYNKGQWTAWPYTYPDYASGAYDTFLSRARKALMEQLSSQKQDT